MKTVAGIVAEESQFAKLQTWGQNLKILREQNQLSREKDWQANAAHEGQDDRGGFRGPVIDAVVPHGSVNRCPVARCPYPWTDCPLIGLRRSFLICP